MARTSRIRESMDSDSDEPQTANTSDFHKKRQSDIQPLQSILSPISSINSDKGIRSPNRDIDKICIPMSVPGSRVVNERSHRKRPPEDLINESPRQRICSVEVEGDNSDGNYDPDQDIEERRILRRGLRDLNKNLVEHRTEYMNAESTGLEDTITQANKISRQVKQTSDATIDSHLLVTAADITYKRTVAIVSGESSQGVDLDDFIHRCKLFMRQGDEGRSGLSAQDSITAGNGLEIEDEDAEDETLNWEFLGRHACFQYTGRPCVPGFLLGPLSTEKKAKRVVVRKAALKISSLKESRPEILQERDIVRDEDLNLSTMCQRITTQLEKIREDAMTAAELETRDGMTSQEIEVLLDKYSLSRNVGIALFKFVINPFSFSQSVENLFYVSFLIRDGKMAVTIDDRGMPYLELRDDGESSNRPGGPTKHQAILALDILSWKQLINLFEIKEPMIRHREDVEVHNMGAKGWYA